MTETVIDKLTEKMEKSLEVLRDNLSKVRTGRAHVGFLDQVKTDYYGTETPLPQVANVTLIDARTLAVKPYDKNMARSIEKAIRDSDLGLNPVLVGDLIRVPMPMLTEETRKHMIKLVHSEGEEGKVALRNIRRDAISHIKNELKEKELSEDEARRLEEAVQKKTDLYVNKVGTLIAEKEKELLAI